MSQPIKVGLSVGSATLPAWQVALIESVQRSREAEVVAALIEDWIDPSASAPNAGHASTLQRLLKQFEDDGRSSGPDALAALPCSAILEGIPQITVPPSRQLDNFRAELRNLDLDVILALSDPDQLSLFAPFARLGIWYFECCGDKFQPSDGSQVALAEVIRRSSVVHTALRVRLGGMDRELVAYQSYSGVDCLSHTATCRAHLWKCSTFPARAIKQCYRIGADAFLRSLPAARDEERRVATYPTGNGLLRSVALVPALLSYGFWRYRQKQLRRRYRERWSLLFTSRPETRVLHEFDQLAPPEDRFWADPHVIEQGGLHYVFFEDASCESGKGRISCMRRDRDGRFSKPVCVLDRPYHLSYPFVFEWKGEYFLIPESAENRTIELYRCVRFPHEWEFVHNLMAGVCAYDATLVEHEGRWWMFAALIAREGISSWDELYVFHADSPMSRDWQPHPDNPVISDVRTARPAGALFRIGTRLIRPSQNSAGRYGRALNFNDVQELSTGRYRETVRDTIEPSTERGLLAVHTFSQAGDLTFVDSIRREPRR